MISVTQIKKAAQMPSDENEKIKIISIVKPVAKISICLTSTIAIYFSSFRKQTKLLCAYSQTVTVCKKKDGKTDDCEGLSL